MSNIEKYNTIFTEVFGVPVSQLCDAFGRDNVSEWDSVHQLNLVNRAEEIFDIMLEPEEIMGFTSYGAGRKILASQGIEI